MALTPLDVRYPVIKGLASSSGFQCERLSTVFALHSRRVMESSEQFTNDRPRAVSDAAVLVSARAKFAGYAIWSAWLPASLCTVQRVRPPRPRFVRTWSTPFAAAVP